MSMLSDELWPIDRAFHALLASELKSKVHGRFNEHEFDKRVAEVRHVAGACLTRIRKQNPDVAGIELVRVYIEDSPRKKTIAIGLRLAVPQPSPTV